MNRALVVDDKLENRYLLKALLNGHGFEVVEADNGEEALRAAKHSLPNLVITDLLMPVMDGYTLLRNWRADAQFANIPFIVYTATYTDPKDEKLALDLGADAFIVKPTEPACFMEQVWEILRRTEAANYQASAPGIDQAEAFKRYSEVLVRKLEKKSAQLDHRAALLSASEEHIRRLNRLYVALSETHHAIVHCLDRDELFREVCRIAVERGGLKIAWAGWLDARSGEIEAVAWAGTSKAWIESASPFSISGERRSPVEIALGEDQVYVCNDLFAAPRHAPLREEMKAAGLGAVASLPLRLNSHAVAALTFYAGESDYFDEKMMSLVLEMATDVSFALRNIEREDWRRQAEEELRRVNQELEDRVAARTAELETANKDLEAYAYTVSHDLRAPLRSIEGFTKIVLETKAAQLDERARGYLERVCRAVHGMELLIGDLLELSRLSRQEIRIEEVDLSALAEELLKELRDGAPHCIFDARIAPDCRARGDVRLLRVLLHNLLENAIKYSSKTPSARLEFGCEMSGGERVYVVRDNGAGFYMNYAQRLFQPFQRMHHPDEFQGTGIGLATVARIVARHQGRIWAESALGQGASFKFTLGSPAEP